MKFTIFFFENGKNFWLHWGRRIIFNREVAKYFIYLRIDEEFLKGKRREISNIITIIPIRILTTKWETLCPVLRTFPGLN